MVKSVSEENYEAEVLEADSLVLVDFWASWCGPCKVMGETLDQLEPQYKDKVKFVKIDIEEAPDLAAQYGIRSIPTILLLQGGQSVQTLVGNKSSSEIEAVLNANLDTDQETE